MKAFVQTIMHFPRSYSSLLALLLSLLFLPTAVLAKQIRRKSIDDLACSLFQQPLNHFYVPAEASPTFWQRYCVYDKYSNNDDSSSSPIFLYTGNESPLEQYINHTGLLWELAPEFNATVIFVEHRYEGHSKPASTNPHCLSYSSSKQALEDYARLTEYYLLYKEDNSNDQTSATTDPQHSQRLRHRPVIAFGGSYGGMLAAWMRMKYPHLIAGAVAASAPIWALPRTTARIDGAHRIVYRSLNLPYPPTSVKKKKKTPITHQDDEDDHKIPNHCANNLRATWPLLQYLAGFSAARHKLAAWFRTCQPIQHARDVTASLVDWIRTPWFDLAEGSFPYSSSYIPSALLPGHAVYQLPPWPLQAACWINSTLHADWGVRYHGNLSNVRYNITYRFFDNKDDNTEDTNASLTLAIDWDKLRVPPRADADHLDMLLASPNIAGLLTSVRDAVAVWYNITQQESCFNLTPAVNLEATPRNLLATRRHHASKHRRSALDAEQGGKHAFSNTNNRQVSSLRTTAMIDTSTITSRLTDFLLGTPPEEKNSTASCQARIDQDGSWGPLCCNENMNLIIYEAEGMGRDHLWPPTYPRGTASHADVIRHDPALRNQTVPPYCADLNGYFGFSQLPVDPWATRMDTYYGGTRIASHSNIVFSNGLLDPWIAGGVAVPWEGFINQTSYNGPTVIPIGKKDPSSDMIALLIEFGGHHTDLMYSHELDPPSVTAARQVEKEYIAKWIAKFYSDGKSSH